MLFTTRQCQDGTPTMTPPLRAPARGVDDAMMDQNNNKQVTSDDRRNGAGTRDGEAKTMTATSIHCHQTTTRHDQNGTRGMMRTEEQKVQAIDTAPYNEEHKKGPRDVVNVSISFFFISFFLLLTMATSPYLQWAQHNRWRHYDAPPPFLLVFLS